MRSPYIFKQTILIQLSWNRGRIGVLFISLYFVISFSLLFFPLVNTFMPSNAHMHQWIRASLVHRNGCRLFGAKSLSRPKLFWQWITRNKKTLKWKFNTKLFRQNNTFENAVCRITTTFVSPVVHNPWTTLGFVVLNVFQETLKNIFYKSTNKVDNKLTKMQKCHGGRYWINKITVDGGWISCFVWSNLAQCTVYPKKYAHDFVVLCFVVVMQSFIMNSHEVFIHIHQGCFAGTGAIVRLPQCQWSKPDGYGKISQCITTTKHSKAKTVCIFLGIYCILSLTLPVRQGNLLQWNITDFGNKITKLRMIENSFCDTRVVTYGVYTRLRYLWLRSEQINHYFADDISNCFCGLKIILVC